jgi:predicted ATPase
VRKSPKPDAAKAETFFDRALTVARQQQAKSWELRAAMSMARPRRNQGKPQQARELLPPVYGWFTEGFDARDLKEADALLDIRIMTSGLCLFFTFDPGQIALGVLRAPLLSRR